MLSIMDSHSMIDKDKAKHKQPHDQTQPLHSILLREKADCQPQTHPFTPVTVR